MKKLNILLSSITLSLLLGLSTSALACDTFDPGEDSDTCLSNCVNAGCDTQNAGCSTYCDMQTYSPE